MEREREREREREKPALNLWAFKLELHRKLFVQKQHAESKFDAIICEK